MKSVVLVILFFVSVSSCKQKNPFLISFEYERVMRSTNPQTGILEVKNQIPQDFPNHKDYVKYGEMENYPENYKSYKEVFKDSTIIIFDKPNGGCFQVKGTTSIKNDTLFLNHKMINNGCTEEEIYRLKYVIQNSEEYLFIDY